MKSCCKEIEEQDGHKDKIVDQENDGRAAKGWLSRLKTKWQVRNILQVVLILCTFAIGGSMCGYLGKRVMAFLNIENKVFWVFTYIVMVTIFWPLCVLLISIPFGQFRFFCKYLKQMGNRMVRRKK